MSDGVDAPPAGVEEELTFEHEEDVEIVVHFDATFLRLGGGGGCILSARRIMFDGRAVVGIDRN